MGYLIRTCLLAILASSLAKDALDPCSRRVHWAMARQTDENGHGCWDRVKVAYCGGRCDSREISDWQFPYKRSHHHVCLYTAWRPLVVKLRHCDAGAASDTDTFRYVVADECRCKVCSSQYASCEWLPPNSTLLDNITDSQEDN